MRLINKTKNTVLATEVKIAGTIFTRLKGLLGKKELPKGEALVIKSCNSIHTFFMRFPIDVLFVDKGNRVVEVISSLPTFRISAIYFKASFAIELPSGTITPASVSKGDILLIE
ncbi:MAG: DUF192 domain-containing protein [Candidatus Omnitrophica bacterium]|nr:DUF192 domain-containing protein [Candidatus Omnitrophota bacterium]